MFKTAQVVLFVIRFKTGDQFPIVRRKHFTGIEIFAFVGGLLGLFLGISVITFAEVVSMLLQPLFQKFSMRTRFWRIECRQKHDRSKFFVTISKVTSYVNFYLKKSSIHSFNFMAEAKNNFERIFWFLTFSVLMTACFTLILQLYQTMDFKAVTLMIDDQQMDVSEIPFPEITIFASFPNSWELGFFAIESLNTDYDYTENDIFKGVAHPAARFEKISVLVF